LFSCTFRLRDGTLASKPIIPTMKARLEMTNLLDKLITQQQAVEITGMSPAWFEMSRFKKTGIPYVKIGRAVRYREQDIRQFITDHMVGTGI